MKKGDGDGESGRDQILKAPLRKTWAAAPAAEDPWEEWPECPPGLNKEGPIEEKSGDKDLSNRPAGDNDFTSLKHDCIGECCSEGF